MKKIILFVLLLSAPFIYRRIHLTIFPKASVVSELVSDSPSEPVANEPSGFSEEPIAAEPQQAPEEPVAAKKEEPLEEPIAAEPQQDPEEPVAIQEPESFVEEPVAAEIEEAAEEPVAIQEPESFVEEPVAAEVQEAPAEPIAAEEISPPADPVAVEEPGAAAIEPELNKPARNQKVKTPVLVIRKGRLEVDKVENHNSIAQQKRNSSPKNVLYYAIEAAEQNTSKEKESDLLEEAQTFDEKAPSQ